MSAVSPSAAPSPASYRTPGPRLSAGVNTADWTRLREDLQILRGTGAWAHIDLMDGRFCPPLTGGAGLVRAVADCDLSVDAHLLVEEPRRFLAEVVAAGAHVVTVHVEATRQLFGTLTELTALAQDGAGLIRGVGLAPGTPVHALEPVIGLVDAVTVLAVDPGQRGQPPAAATRRRVAQVRTLAAEQGVDPLVTVDGGVTLANVAEASTWGADVVVSGSAIFDGVAPAENLRHVLAALGANATSAAHPSSPSRSSNATGEPR